MSRTPTRLSNLWFLLVLSALASCGEIAGPDLKPPEPDPLRPAASRVVSLVMAFQSKCALTADGQLHCWGENRFGEFGNGTAVASSVPVRTGGDLKFVSVHGSMGTPQICGIVSGGAAYCWGYNLNGELGGGTTTQYVYSPIPVVGGVRFRMIASSYHTCGVDTEGRAYCWGSGLGGQLGTGSDRDMPTPTRIASDASYATITNGLQFSCALRVDGAADCWGLSVGRGNAEGPVSASTPLPVSGSLIFRDISAGEEHVCALTVSGEPYCWGVLTSFGGTTQTPVKIPSTRTYVQVASASRTVRGASCGVTSEGHAECWQGGSAPLPVPGNFKFKGIVGGHGDFCGHTYGGAAYCWRWATQVVNGQQVLQPSQPVPIPTL